MGWLYGALYAIPIWALLAATQTRRSTGAKTLGRQTLQLVGGLQHEADFVLAFCWAHPDRLPPIIQKGDDGRREPLAGPICAALSDLRAAVVELSALSDVREAVEVLLQRFEDHGYQWQSVPKGTKYDETMQDAFDTFGSIESGRPVWTRRAAMLHYEKVIQKGLLRLV